MTEPPTATDQKLSRPLLLLFGLLVLALIPALPIYLWRKGRLSKWWCIGISTVMVAAFVGVALTPAEKQDEKPDRVTARSKPKAKTTASPTATPTPSASLSAKPSPAPQKTTPSPKPKPKKTAAADSPAVRCQSRPSTGSEVLVRYITPEEPANTSRLGAGYVWNFGDKECITSAESALLSDPGIPGNCTQVAYVDENPGYDEDRIPSLPFSRLLAQAGDC